MSIKNRNLRLFIILTVKFQRNKRGREDRGNRKGQVGEVREPVYNHLIERYWSDICCKFLSLVKKDRVLFLLVKIPQDSSDL